MIKILFVLIGMIPMGLSVMIGVAASHETEDGKSERGFRTAAVLFFAGLSLTIGLCNIGSDGWYWWFIISGVLFVLTFILYKFWQK